MADAPEKAGEPGQTISAASDQPAATSVQAKPAAKKAASNPSPAKGAAATRRTEQGVPPEVAKVRQILPAEPPHRGKRSAAEQSIDRALPQLEAHVQALVEERDTAKRALAQTISKGEEDAALAERRLAESEQRLSEAQNEAANTLMQLTFERRYLQPLLVQIVRLTGGEVSAWRTTGLSSEGGETHRAEWGAVRFAVSAVNGQAFLGVEFQVGRQAQTYTITPNLGLEAGDAIALHHLLTATDEELREALPREVLDRVFTTTFLSRVRARSVGFAKGGQSSRVVQALGRPAIAGTQEDGPLDTLRYRPQSGKETPGE